MKIFKFFIALFLIHSFQLKAKINEFYNIGGHATFSIMDNFAYGTSTSPNRVFYGGGLNYGFSMNDEFNVLIGLDLQSVSPNNTRSDYELCGDDPTCLPISKSFQFFMPIGFEYYSNTNRSRFQSYYNAHLIPSFSATEKIEVTPYDIQHVEQTTYTIKNNGFKFQNLYLSIGVNNEFGINEKFKIFIEPSMRYSLLFRKEDVVNPTYMLMIRVGCKLRSLSKK